MAPGFAATRTQIAIVTRYVIGEDCNGFLAIRGINGLAVFALVFKAKEIIAAR